MPGLRQRELAEATGLRLHTVELLEVAVHCVFVADGAGAAAAGTLRDRVALDERLRRAAGGSLRVSATRAHQHREAMQEQLLREAGEALVLGDHKDSLGAAMLAELSARAAFGQGPAAQPDGWSVRDGAGSNRSGRELAPAQAPRADRGVAVELAWPDTCWVGGTTSFVDLVLAPRPRRCAGGRPPQPDGGFRLASPRHLPAEDSEACLVGDSG